MMQVVLFVCFLKCKWKLIINHTKILQSSLFTSQQKQLSIYQNMQGINHQLHATESKYSLWSSSIPKKAEYQYNCCLVKESFSKTEGLFQNRWKIHPKLSNNQMVKKK